MPLKGAYSADELAQRCARDEIEIDRLRAEIERLRALVQMGVNCLISADIPRSPDEMNKLREEFLARANEQ